MFNKRRSKWKRWHASLDETCGRGEGEEERRKKTQSKKTER